MSVLDRQDPFAMGERLRAARVKAGLTQEGVAEALSLARTTLVAIEKGQRSVRSEELRRMAALYGASVNSLLRPSAIHVDIVPRFRAMPDVDEAKAQQVAKMLNELAAAEVELERLLGQPLKTNYPAERPLLPGDIREQAEDAAAELRHRLGLGLAPIADLVSLLELEIGMRIFIRPLPDASISGLYIFDDALGACILLNQNHPRERRAVSAGHEFGHCLAKRREPDVVDLGQAPQSREERFATAFSLALLMPATAIRRRFHDFGKEAGRFSPRHLVLLSHMFFVSPEAMCRRLEELQLLPGGTWESLRDRGFSGETVKQVLGDKPKPQELVIPPRLWMLASEAYRGGLLTEGQLAQMLHMDRVEIRVMLDTLGAEGEHAAESVQAD